jgi:hypothetical protein
VFSKPEIKDLFKQYELVQLYTDKVPSYYVKDPKHQVKYAKVNQEFQRKAFGDIQLPLYVILEPQRDGKTIKVVARYDEGKINKADEFARFLKDNLPAGNAQAQAGR